MQAKQKVPVKPSSPPPKDSADPMLQGTYLQDDAKDFEPSTDEIAAFEERLHHGGSGSVSGAPTTAATPTAANPRRHSAPAPAPSRTSPHVYQPATAAGSGVNVARRNQQRRLSEEEQEEAMQRKEDVNDVRELDARFGGAADDDSD